MRKIFIDCGAHKGESVAAFRKKQDSNQFEIYMFEPNPFLFEEISDNISLNNCIKIEAAVSNREGKEKLWGCIKVKDSVGASLERSKADTDKISQEDYVEVRTIRLSDFIKETFSKEDKIILKMDIEGSEYDVLEDLIATETIDYIDRIYCEFHGHKMNRTYLKREANIRAFLARKKITISHWNAL